VRFPAVARGFIRHELKAATDVDERFRQLERSMAARHAAIEESKREPYGEVDRGQVGLPRRDGKNHGRLNQALGDRQAGVYRRD
jgi:hypothetical protein